MYNFNILIKYGKELTIIRELVEQEEVLGVEVQRDLEAFAVIFGSKEELDEDFLSSWAFDVDAYVEGFVVQTCVLGENRDFFLQHLG